MLDQEIYRIFGKVLIRPNRKVSHSKMLALSIPRGIYVPQEACYEWLYDELKPRDYNKTFYSKWMDVVSKSRVELLIDQLSHYYSTYGTDFQGEAYVPNVKHETEFDFAELKVVKTFTEEEYIEELKKLFVSNIAMSRELLLFLANHYDALVPLEAIKNRELKLMCIPDTYKFKDGQECLLWILYHYMGITQLVKSKEELSKFRPVPDMNKVLFRNAEVLSSVFYRNKDVFMTFKSEKSLKPTINYIRRLAVKNHKPMLKSDWLRLEELSKEERKFLYSKASLFKLVQMYNALYNPTGYYLIRNGKAFYKETRERDISSEILAELFKEIVSKVASKNITKVNLPQDIHLAMPTSEKNFIGNLPIGSYVDCKEKNTMVGIYWENSWGARDLDLHVKLSNGDSIGWNSSYYAITGDVVFSGDMTNAPEGASEVMWFKNTPPNSIVNVLKYNGDDKYHYRMFLAQEETIDFKKNYMVDPRNIFFDTDLQFEGKSDNTLGFFSDGKFYFHNCNIGNSVVPNMIREKILNHLLMCRFLSIETVLQEAGIEVSKDAEVSLSSKAEIIEFFS